MVVLAVVGRHQDPRRNNGNGAVQTTHRRDDHHGRSKATRRGQLQCRSRSIGDAKFGLTTTHRACCTTSRRRITVRGRCPYRWCGIIPIGGKVPDSDPSGQFQGRHHQIPRLGIFTSVIADCVDHRTTQRQRGGCGGLDGAGRGSTSSSISGRLVTVHNGRARQGVRTTQLESRCIQCCQVVIVVTSTHCRRSGSRRHIAAHDTVGAARPYPPAIIIILIAMIEWLCWPPLSQQRCGLTRPNGRRRHLFAM